MWEVGSVWVGCGVGGMCCVWGVCRWGVMYGECVGGERGWGVMCVGSVWVGCDVCGRYGVCGM